MIWTMAVAAGALVAGGVYLALSRDLLRAVVGVSLLGFAANLVVLGAGRLGATQLVACAAPAYLHRRGTPRAPVDLAKHSVLTYAYAAAPNVWRLLDDAGQAQDVRVAGPLHTNSGELLVAAAVAGMGIVFEPDFVVGPALARGELTRVLTEFAGPRLDVWAVYPSRRHLSAKVRAFVAYLAEVFAGDPLRSPPMARTATRRPRNPVRRA